MPPRTYYPHLPKNNIKLLTSRVYIGGSLAVPRMCCATSCRLRGIAAKADLLNAPNPNRPQCAY
jgi:hypothetical protein